ncbi:efflux RND transporter periplasmic adaptor subunit [Desulfuromonas carbonis]
MKKSHLIIAALILLAAGLGWGVGAHAPDLHAAAEAHGEEAHQDRSPATAEAQDEHAGHGHAPAADEHAGHDHGAAPDAGEYCVEHQMPEAVDVLCNPPLLASLLPGEGVLMRLATPEAAERAGILIAAAEPAQLAAGQAVPARVLYNRSRLAEVMALSGGVVRRLAVEPGQRVTRGGLLAEIDSPAVATARADYRAALGRLELAAANVRREQELVERGVSARRELEQAQAEEQASRAAAEQLREQLQAFDAAADADAGSRLALRSPLTGTVVARHVVLGQTLAPETLLFTVADLSTLWLELQLSPAQLQLARVGAAIEAEFDDLPGRRFAARITQVASGLDPQTRLLRVVAEVANPDGTLKDGLFGQAFLAGAETVAGGPAMVAVPAAAVQSIDGKAYVFVAREKDLFEVRRVAAGPRRGDDVLLAAGVQAGERVAASQGFALKSELLKSRLGASCADH